MADVMQDALRLLRESQATGSRRALDEGIATLEAGVERQPEGSAERSRYLNVLGRAYRLRFDVGHDRQDLERAIHAAGLAVSGASVGSPEHAHYLDDLETTRAVAYLTTGIRGQIDQAIEEREAYLGSLPDDPELATRFTMNLAIDYRHRYEGEGDPHDLQRSGAILSDLRQRLAPGDPAWFQLTWSLADLYAERARVTDRVEDLGAAVSLRAEALREAPAGIAGLTDQTQLLGQHLMLLYQATGDPSMLEQAIAIWDGVARDPDAAPDVVARALNNEAALIELRYRQSGEPADLDDAIATLEAALDASTEAISVSPEAVEDRARFTASLAGLLRERHGKTHDPGDLARARELTSQAQE